MRRNGFSLLLMALTMIVCLTPMEAKESKQMHAAKLKISSIKRTVSRVDPVLVTVMIENLSNVPITIPTFDSDAGYFGMFVLDVSINQWLGGKKAPVPSRRPFKSYRDCPYPSPHNINPGKSWKIDVDINAWFPASGAQAHLPPGNYEISATYDISPWLKLAGSRSEFFEGRLESSPIKITVTQ